MPYTRPKPDRKISPEKKAEVIREYVEHYRSVFPHNPAALNRKVPRKVFASVLDEIGELLVRRAEEIAAGEKGELSEAIEEFLEKNPLPPSMEALLTPELRTFSLLLQSLRQWTAAESLATDRWILSGNVRNALRDAGVKCAVTGEPIDRNDIELHHPVRDGRPPVPLSSKGHRTIEKQEPFSPNDPVGKVLVALRRQKRGRYSWKAIWEGCCLHMGETFEFESPNRAAFCRSLANWYVRESDFPVDQIRQWIEEQNLIDPQADL